MLRVGFFNGTNTWVMTGLSFFLMKNLTSLDSEFLRAKRKPISISIVSKTFLILALLFGFPLITTPAESAQLDHPIILTQIPVDRPPESYSDHFDYSSWGTGGRIVVLEPEGRIRVLTSGFSSASDPAVSFDGRKILFAGKKSPCDD